MAGSAPALVDTTWPVIDIVVSRGVRYYKYKGPDGWFCSCFSGYDMASDRHSCVKRGKVL